MKRPADNRHDYANRPIIGWREKVAFPDWNIRNIEAKIDTGARTSALHVEDISVLSGNRVSFHVVTNRKNPERRARVTATIVRQTRVRSSTGHRQLRIVVSARVRIGRVIRRIEVSLVRRDHMLCRMLVGRSALEGLLVDATERHLMRPRVKARRKATP